MAPFRRRGSDARPDVQGASLTVSVPETVSGTGDAGGGRDGTPSPPPVRDAAGEATLALFRSNDAYTEFLWNRLEELSPRRLGGRVLEVGCGIGNLTRILLRSGAVTYLHALDMDPAYVERVRAELPDPRLEVSTARAEAFCPQAFSSAGSGFDFIVCSNVLEHVEQDDRAVENFRRMLRPDGLILLLVPAHPFLFCGLDRNLSHFRRYRKDDIESLARSCGLDVVAIRHFNPLGVLGWWLNGKVLRRSTLPGRQLSMYSRFAIGLSGLLDRCNPLALGISLLAVLERSRGGARR